MDRDDDIIISVLSIARIPADMTNSILQLIKPCKSDNKYRYLSLEYLAISSYVLTLSCLTINENIMRSSTYMSKDADKELAYRVIYRYCLYILKNNNIPF